METGSKIESREQPKRNLLNNYEETVAAMAEIEGKVWQDLQKEDGEYTTSGAVKWLEKLGPIDESEDNRQSVRIVYGAGGYNRWPILRDGTVCFSFQHGRKAASRAEALGFEIFGK